MHDLRLRLTLGFVLLAGCGRVHLGTHDSGEDGGSTAIDGGAPVICGDTVCPAGMVCCDPDCGICTAPGGACPAIECVPGCTSNADCDPGFYCRFAQGLCGPDPAGEGGTCEPIPDACIPVVSEVCGCDGTTYLSECDAQRVGVSIDHQGECGACAPQDIRGEGPCPAYLGAAWSGERCVSVGGCDCAGADCDRIYAELADCERAYVGCTSCAPQQAIGEGACDLSFGWAWDGATCTSVSGCTCTGADCSDLYADRDACLAGHSHCVPPSGCASSAECADGEYCHYEAGSCGAAGTSGDCRPIPPELICPSDQPIVCGCDGDTYSCEDAANQVGVSVRHEGACATGPCAAMDAWGEGACFLVLGVKWNGVACEQVGGCSCAGADCDRLYPNESECQTAHAACATP